MTTTVRVTLTEPHSAQWRVLSEAARFNVVACGRRWGKSELGMERASRAALDGYPVGWYAPTYKDAGEVWRDLKRTLAPVVATKNETEKRLELVTGGAIDVWTLDDPDSSRGRKYGRVIVDEAAKVQRLEQAWTETIRPTLTDYRGDAWFLSTPKGRNYFWRLFQQHGAGAKGWRAWQMPTAANPLLDPAEIADAREQLPQSAFAQEYLAEFSDDAGAVFRNVRGCVDAGLLGAQPMAVVHRYYAGLDWAQMADFTVIAVVSDDGRLVALDRFNQVGWGVQYGRVKAASERWTPSAALAELNSIGSPNLERLHAEGLPVWRAFTMTNQSKAEVVQALALAFERGEVRIPPDPVLISELEAFEAERLPSGKWRYSAPPGAHDDTVIALALAWEARNRGPRQAQGLRVL